MKNKKIAALVLGTMMGTMVFGLSSNAAAAEITLDEAIKAALTDAGLTEDDVLLYKFGREFENGREVYDVNFLVPKENKYEYDIDLMTGEVLKREMDRWEAEDEFEYGALLSGAAADYIDNEKALEAALADAGLAKENVTVIKSLREADDGRMIYEIDFIVPGEVKYEYDIDAVTANIFAKEKNLWDAEDEMEYAALLKAAEAVTDAGTQAAAGASAEDLAKETALLDAGLAENQVSRLYAHMDYDDGREVIDVQFYDANGYEYSYEIDAKTGNIIERDIEIDD